MRILCSGRGEKIDIGWIGKEGRKKEDLREPFLILDSFIVIECISKKAMSREELGLGQVRSFCF